YTLQYLEENHGKKWPQNERLKNLHARLHIDLDHLNRELEANDDGNESTLKDYNQFYLELLEHQRKILNEMNRRTEFDEDLIRKYLSLIDMEEHKLREKLTDGVSAT
ncbi:MAG TPA: Na+/H+ antiporter, partial [Flavisolibacter sp.]|nr:Na+/H+ antiporter [Flavisolibacter sp.]